MTAKHSQLPWNRGFGNWIYQGERAGSNQRLIAICEPTKGTKDQLEETFANAAFIVKAVNSHEKLCTALEDCLSLLRGHISGPAQKAGIIKEAQEALKLAGARDITDGGIYRIA